MYRYDSVVTYEGDIPTQIRKVLYIKILAFCGTKSLDILIRGRQDRILFTGN